MSATWVAGCSCWGERRVLEPVGLDANKVTPESTMMTIALSRQNPDVVHCATRGGQVFGTQDGGATWQEYPLPEGLQDIYAVACG